MTLGGNDLMQLLASPRSVAVVGASTNPGSASGRPLEYLRRYGFEGRVVPVNRQNPVVQGLPAVVSLDELQVGSVDIVVIAVPAQFVVESLFAAERIGVRVAVIIGSGFESRTSELRCELDRFIAGSGMRVIGPNCVGTLAVDSAAFLTFSSVLSTEAPTSGDIGLITQSGALGNSLLQTLIRRNVGLSQWVSTGNELDVGAMELATGMLRQNGTNAVGLFLEGVTDPEWLPTLEDALRGGDKRLFVLKAGSSAAGQQAAAGHTGRVVGSSATSDAILAELGAREVPTVAALADALVVAGTSRELLTRTRPRVSLVSVSGAAGVIGADRVARHDRLAMAGMDQTTVDTLTQRLDARLTPANPLDVPFIDDTAAFADAVAAFAAVDTSGLVVAVESGLAHDREELSAKLVAGRAKSPIVLTSLSEDDQLPATLIAALARAGVAYLPTIERAVDAVAACCANARTDSDDTPTAVDEQPVEGLEWVTGRLPAEFPWARWRLVEGREGLLAAATDLGLPLVIKAAGRTIAHRTELGAVRVVRDRAQLDVAFDAVAAICAIEGDMVVAQEVVPDGLELMVSAVRDREFGAVVFVQPGGTFTERATGRAILWSGWDRQRRDRILRRSKVGTLLHGYRRGKKYDLEALGDLVTTALAAVVEGMSFLEMNPVIVDETGIRVVDTIARP